MTENANNFSILFITRKWAPAVGGMETYSHRLTEELSNIADTDTFVLPGQENGMSPSPVQLLKFGLNSALKLLARKPADVTHLGDMALWPLAIFARLRSRHTRLVISAHGTDVSYPLRGGLWGNLYGWYLHAGSKLLPNLLVVANSGATRDALVAYGYKDIRIVKLATDVTCTPPVGTPDGHLLFVGRLVKRKGLSWFVKEVLPLLGQDVKVHVAGTVWDPEEGQALSNDRVQYLGSLSQNELMEEYARAMCVVIPNISVPNGEFEGFGLVAVEAAAAGGVVLAARHSGLLDAVIDGETGFQVASGDARAWVGKIAEISGWTDEERLKFVESSVDAVRTHYSWKRVAEETYAAYEIQGARR